MAGYNDRLQWPVTMAGYNGRLQWPVTMTGYNGRLQWPVTTGQLQSGYNQHALPYINRSRRLSLQLVLCHVDLIPTRSWGIFMCLLCVCYCL